MSVNIQSACVHFGQAAIYFRFRSGNASDAGGPGEDSAKTPRTARAPGALELWSAGSAGFPACGFGRLSSRQSLVHRTGKSGKPAGWKACPTFRSIESGCGELVFVPSHNCCYETYGRPGHLLSILRAAIVQGKKFGWFACIFSCNLLAAK